MVLTESSTVSVPPAPAAPAVSPMVVLPPSMSVNARGFRVASLQPSSAVSFHPSRFAP